MVVTLQCGIAHAEGREPRISAADRAVAEALFDQGLAAMKAKDYDLACPKFAESHHLAPSASTAFNLGRCYWVTQRLASAWASFRQSAHIARLQNDDRVLQVATTAAEALQIQLAKLVISVPSESRTDQLEVLRNGSRVSASLWGSAIPLDSGKHTIEVRAPGRIPWTTAITVPNEPTVITVEVPRLQPVELSDPSMPEQPPNAPTAARPAPLPPPTPPDPGFAQRMAGYVVGGAGGALLIAGASVGVHALVKNSASNNFCGQAAGLSDSNTCTPEGKPLRDAAQRAGVIAIGLLVAGGLTSGIGVTLYLTEPGEPASVSNQAARRPAAKRPALHVRASPGGILLRGHW